jgi:hypothetical protein
MKLSVVLTMCAMLIVAMPSQAQVECYGEGEYEVCTSTTTDSNGDVQVESWDTEGNTYSVGTQTTHGADGDMEIKSYDSEGNSYSIRSFTDSVGSHTIDSEGNKCTITWEGEMIGCR